VYGGKITRYNKVTGDVQDVAPRGKYRYLRTAPVLFSEFDRRLLYLGAQVVLKTIDGGQNWEAISPDLSRETWELPTSVAAYPIRRSSGRRGAAWCTR
jgi:hypothetical protein